MGKGNGEGLHRALRKLNLRGLPTKLRLDSFPANIPASRGARKGFFAIYVGEEAKRYAIPLGYLKHPIFLELLGMAEEEFGFGHAGSGLLQIPCHPAVFERLVAFIREEDGGPSSEPQQ
ncbi:auxin-induced protein 6B-like [Wolffia australiana]